MESSGVIEKQFTFGAGSDHRAQRRTNAVEDDSAISGPQPFRSCTTAATERCAKIPEDALEELNTETSDAVLQTQLDSVAWSWRQWLVIVCFVVSSIGFAVHTYRDSEARLHAQAWIEGHDAGKLVAVDPIHNVHCPYEDPGTGDAWRRGFRAGYRNGKLTAPGLSTENEPKEPDAAAVQN